MRLHGEVSDDEVEEAVMDPAALSSPPNGAAVAAALAAPRLVVGYALTKKKVKSFLEPKMLLLARQKPGSPPRGMESIDSWGIQVVNDFKRKERV